MTHTEKTEHIVRTVTRYADKWTFMRMGDVRTFVEAAADMPDDAFVKVVGVQKDFFVGLMAEHWEGVQ